MANADRERWNARYQAGDEHLEPDAWLLDHAQLLSAPRPRARALDLACGSGRHSLWLAELGYAVDAWDISDVGLELLESELARRRAAGAHLSLATARLDLETASIPAETYYLVLDAFFLDRRLFGEMIKGLQPGGLLVVRTLMHRGANDDRNPDFLLEPGELRATFSGLEILDEN